MRRLIVVAATALAMGGCTEIARSSSPPVPPFRVAPHGPGIDPDRGGVAVDVRSDEDRIARYRLGASSVRVYDGDAVPIGRVRMVSDGYDVVLRDGVSVGHVAVDDGGATVTFGARRFDVTCDPEGCVILDGHRIVAVPSYPTDDARDGERTWDLTEDAGRLTVSSGDIAREIRLTRWRRPALVVLATSLAWDIDGVPDRLATGALAFAVERAATPQETANEGSGATPDE